MCEGVPNTESEYAAEGTHAHGVASQELERYFFNREPAGGWLAADTEMRLAVSVYTEFVKREARASGANIKAGHILIEHRFDLSAIHPGLFGTADAVIYFPAEKKLLVADYKHGAGIAVEVEDSLQLQYYALGALISTNLPCETVELAIIQPRCNHEDGPIRRWTFSSFDLLDFAADLADDAAATLQPDAPLNPGKHCRFCPAAATKCPAIKQKAQAMAKLEFQQDAPYNPADLDQALRAVPMMESWIKKVREFAYGEAMHGRMPPGWKIVAKRATRKWAAPDEAVVDYMLDATKKDQSELFETPKLKTPAQMEKLCSKQIGEGLRKLMVSVSSGYNLVPESDPRPGVKMDPQSDFTKIEGGIDE